MAPSKKGVRTYEFIDFLRKDNIVAPHLRGVFAKNQLPKKPTAGFYIVNTDDADKAGEHWVVLLMDVARRGEYFDSMGLPPLHDAFMDFLAQCQQWIFNEHQLQQVGSLYCGQYCTAYIQYRCRNATMADFVNNFTTNYVLNDNIVKNWLK